MSDSKSKPENMKQCAKCPWRKDVKPHSIPNGYCEKKHAALDDTIAAPGALRLGDTLKLMACHESPIGKERPCVGWLANQIGPGNNLALRLWALGQPPFKLELVGEQHEIFCDTLPKRAVQRNKRRVRR